MSICSSKSRRLSPSETFEQAILKAAPGPTTLYDCVADRPETLPEADFVDAVSQNLSRGRMLVLIVGDGIRREAEALAEFLQSHAGAHFTFALVSPASIPAVVRLRPRFAFNFICSPRTTCSRSISSGTR